MAFVVVVASLFFCHEFHLLHTTCDTYTHSVLSFITSMLYGGELRVYAFLFYSLLFLANIFGQIAHSKREHAMCVCLRVSFFLGELTVA